MGTLYPHMDALGFLISADLEVIDDFITGQSRTAMTRVMLRHS